jgi:hypothetical protein
MATKALTAARSRTKIDPTPQWVDAATWSGDQFTRHFHSAMKYYNLETTNKELKPKVIDWMGRNEYDRDTIQSFKKTKDWRCSTTTGAIAANLLKGMPEVHAGFNNGKSSADWLRADIAGIIENGKYDVEPAEVEKKQAKVIVAPPSIQDRIREQAGQQSEELDVAIDAWITDPEAFDPKAFKIVSLLRGKGVKAAQARYIKTYFKPGHEELLELSGGSADEQLREAYSKNSRKNVKKLIDFYESIMTACDQIAAEAKILKKVRPKKIKPAEDLVKKVKFKLGDDKLGITSVPPAQLVGAQGAVIYNAKTRKIGYYIAMNSNGLAVKGTSITNFTEKSYQKTLRKPPEQIKEFKEQNTKNRFETWFTKSVKTTETMLNGRLNQDIIIIKVFK